jgi:hypothetical protein
MKLDRLSRALVKCARLRHPTFQRIFGRLKSSCGCAYAGKPPNAISRSNWIPESAELRPNLLDAPREDGSWFRLGTGLRLNAVNNPPKQKYETNKSDNFANKEFN